MLKNLDLNLANGFKAGTGSDSTMTTLESKVVSIERRLEELKDITENPYSFKELKGRFRNLRSARFGNHRIIYTVTESVSIGDQTLGIGVDPATNLVYVGTCNTGLHVINGSSPSTKTFPESNKTTTSTHTIGSNSAAASGSRLAKVH